MAAEYRQILLERVVTRNPRTKSSVPPPADERVFFSTPPQPTSTANPDPCVATTGAFVQNCAFGTFGTANRRFFHGPGFNNTDFGMSKRTVIKENYAFDLRVEFFNIFNHAQFRNPGGDITSPNFGIVTNARDPRIGQVSAKFYW